MKERTDFVSNSSSSSFIVNSKNIIYTKNDLKSLVNDMTLWTYDDIDYRLIPCGHIGEICFGWDFRFYKELGDKINFCAIQAIYAKNSNYCDKNVDYWKMLVDVLHEILEDDSVKFIEEYKAVGHSHCYIDHQSSAQEGCNMSMFQSKESLKEFLLTDSYIEGGNDNDEPPEGFCKDDVDYSN